MIRFLAIFIGAGILGVLLLIFLLGGNDGPAYVPADIRLAPRTTDTSIADQKRDVAAQIRKDVLQRVTDAPDHIVDLFVMIANPEEQLNTYARLIQNLSAGEVNESYGKPFPQVAPEYGHTLLREAVISGNTGAAAMLLDRGASVHYNDDEMAFQSVSLETGAGKRDIWFPDYSVGSKFLRMWVDRGGNPNATHPLYGNGNGSILNHVPKNNLEGALVLLDAGADPWSPFAILTDQGDFLYELPSYFNALATGNRLHTEVSFRLAQEGFYKNPPAEHVQGLKQQFEATAQKFLGKHSRNDRNTVWALKKAYKVIYEEMQETPGPNVRDILRQGFESGVGGFFLAPGEIRSPRRSDQYITNRETQVGSNKWDTPRR